MKTASIEYKNSENGELYIDGKQYGPLHSNPTMSDSGTTYQSFVHDHPAEEELGALMIVWETTEAWDNGEANMDDESTACDWDKFTVYDESGIEFAKSE